MEPARYEVKMTCDEVHLPDVRAWVNLHPEVFVEAYPPRQVNSLYFETWDVDCLNDNLIGIGQRKKLRFRWYGDDYSNVQGALELKCKSNKLGWKERYPIPATFDLTTASWRALMQQMREQVAGSFAIWLAYLDQPTLINSYMREYYESVDHKVRVTVDYSQVAYEQITYLIPNLVIRAPIPSQIVVEVKSDARLHRRVSNALSSFPLQVERNSKYVNGVVGSLCFL
jgi:hypothetical protein